MTFTQTSHLLNIFLLGLAYRLGVSLAFLIQCVTVTSQSAKIELFISCSISLFFLVSTNPPWSLPVPTNIYQNSPLPASHSTSHLHVPVLRSML